MGGPRVPAGAAGAADTGRTTMLGFAANLSASIDEAMAFLDGPEATVPHTGPVDHGTNAAKTPPENEAPDARTSKPASPDPARIEAPPPGRDARDARKTNQERDVAKHKQKRQKGNRDSGAPARPSSGPPGATTVTPKDAPLAQPVAVATARADAGITDKGLRVEGNVIHLPSSVEPIASPSDADDSGAHPAVKSDAASDISALREGPGERERTTLPPDEKLEAKTEAKTDEKVEAKTEEKTEAKTEAKTEEKTEAKTEEKTEEKSAVPELRSLTPTERPGAKVDEKISAKPDDKASQGRSSKSDILTTRKEGKGREHKESLSTHLSDEARAFFSEQAYQAAYKADHDSFEDLAPAHEEHPSEVARSRRWMTAAGGVFVALLIVVVGFAAYHSRYAVHETALDTERLASHSNEPITPPEAQHTPPAQPETQPATPPAAGPETQPATPPATPPAAGPETPPATPPAAGPETQPAQPPVAAPPVAAPPVAAPPVAAPTVAAPPAPTGQTPAQLLAAARSFRGALAGRIAAYNTYFDAAPTDDRTMSTFALSLAEMNRNVDAERIATRATAANPRNAQAWFVLAAARNAQHNVAGAREAKTRCIELGGQWAAECRSL